MNKNSSAAMIIKTIATDQQLDTRMSLPPRKTTQTVIEKSYLRSQFERRQRRQIELTNKMHPVDRRDQPDLVASSHELAKRRFFDQLERRESINSARATQQITKAAQLHQQPHQQQQQQQQRPTRTKSNENKQAECSAIKVAANEPDGAGTDADEATSLETIITNSSSSRPNESCAPAAAPLNSLCKVPAPPLDNSKIGHDQQVQQVELRAGTSADGGRDERAQVAACVEQSSEMLAQELQPGRRPSKEEDLRRDRPQPIDDAVERLRPFSLHQQQQDQQREQYANPRSRPPLDGAQGSHGNNVNHDQYDGHRQILNNSQEFAGMQFDGQKEGINLLGHDDDDDDDDDELVPLAVDLLHKSQDNLKSPDCESVQEQQVVGGREPGEQMCDTVQSCAPFLTMSSAMNRAQEEDVRSSCSSSGFGASVSAGSSASSSSEGQPERNRHHHPHFERYSQTKDTDFGRDEQIGSSVQYESFPLNGDFGHLSQIDKGSDEIGQFEIFVGRLDAAAAANLSHQTLSVGPERAHDETDDERPMLHVENHGYGSLGTNERLTLVKPEAKSASNKTKTMRNQTDKRRWPLVNASDLTTELELDSSGQYVNLPHAANESAADNQNATYSMRATAAVAAVSVSGSTAAAGYATVRARPTSLVNMDSRGQRAGAGLANIPPAGNNGHSPATGHESHNSGVLAKLNRHSSDEAAARSGGGGGGELEDCDSHLSGHNSSTSSASSGGFSKLPPVRLIAHNFANNFQFASSSSSSSKAPLERESQRPSARLELESNSIQQHQLQSKRPTSLLKRFGSLVSRAFTSSNNLGGELNGAAIRISANESKDQCDGGAQVSAGARLESIQLTSSTAMPLLKQQSGGGGSTSKLTNGISHAPQQAHKSMENATGLHAKDHHHQEHRAKLLGATDQRRGQQQARQTLKPLDQVREAALVGAGKSLAMAEADLIILSSKRSRNNYQAPRNRTNAGAIDDYYASNSRRNTVELTRGLSEKVSSKSRRCSSRLEQANDSKSGKLTRETSADAFLLRRSVSSASCSSFTSLDNSSLTCSSTRDLSHRQRAAVAPSGASRRQTRRERLHGTSLRRASSLSDELESLISPSELGVESERILAGESQLVSEPLDTCDGTCTKVSQRPSAISVNKNGGGPSGSESTAESTQRDGLAKSRSIMRWFSVNGSVGCSPSPVATNDDRNSIQYETNWPSRESQSSCPRSRRYHDSKSLIDHSHADADCKLNCPKAHRNFAILSSKLQRRPTSKETNGDGVLEAAAEPQPMSLVYSSLNLPNRLPHGDEQSKQRQKRSGHWLRRTVAEEEAGDELGDQLREDELVVNDGKCQSLNLYQNLLRSYVKRRSHNHHRHHRHHNRGHHTHNHHQHHHQSSSSNRNNNNHHHHNRSSSSRHAHCSSSAATATRCGQQQRCASPARRACSCSSDQLSAVGNGKTHGDTASVWGQLIKINKSDGSQVIELERAAGRSWGFFVARGAINNEKGIFISRLNDSSSGGRSLSGLLGVGDRIVSIDNYLIEPDFDILRVNQMISKRSKIFLEVKPFKG